jgi:hypothetical protein
VQLPDFLGSLTDLLLSDVSPSQASANSATNPNPLSFAMQPQQQSEWCWAAVAASISSFYGDAPAKSQCELATQYLQMPCCANPLPPPPPPQWDGNQSYTLDVPLQVLNHLAAPLIPDVMLFEDIVKDINAGKPICCHIKWDQDAPHDGHFNAIVGYDSQTQDLIIHDPYAAYGQSTVPYDTFKSNYHGGSWDQTCRTT